MINKTIQIGRVGNDAESKTFGDRTVTNFSMATTDSFKNKAGEWENETTWFKVSIWNIGKVADHIKKGTLIYVEGKIGLETYTDKEGKEKSNLKIEAKVVNPWLAVEKKDEKLPF